MKYKKLILTALILNSTLLAEEYLLTLDDKHYKNYVAIKPSDSNPVTEPINPQTGITNYTIKVTDNDRTAEIVSDTSYLYDRVCSKVLSDPNNLCDTTTWPNASSGSLVGKGYNHFYDIEFPVITEINYIEIDIAGYKNCGGTTQLIVSYKDGDNFVSTGIKLGASGWDHVARVNLNLTTDILKLTTNNGSCATSYSYIHEFRIY